LILHQRAVRQAVDRDDHDDFLKDVIVTTGPVPLAMVRKRSATIETTRAPVLLIHGFGQNRHAWHLPSRSFANHLAREGFDVFNLDLRGHGRSRHLSSARARNVSDYVSEDLPAAIAEVSRQSGNRRVFLIGHSLGGLISYAAAPSMNGAVAGIVTLGSPYHFARGSLELQAVAVLVRALRVARVRSVGAPVAMRVIASAMRKLRVVADGPLPMPLRGWRPSAIEPHVLDEHLRLAFDHAGLDEMLAMFDWANAKRFGGEREDYVELFESFDVPLLVIAGDDDELAPPQSVRPAFVRSASLDKTYRSLPFGHVDMLVGREAPKHTWPLVVRWLTARSETSRIAI
jgi:pimeloyl-ACP methyl ester carboxylesterase